MELVGQVSELMIPFQFIDLIPIIVQNFMLIFKCFETLLDHAWNYLLCFQVLPKSYVSYDALMTHDWIDLMN